MRWGLDKGSDEGSNGRLDEVDGKFFPSLASVC